MRIYLAVFLICATSIGFTQNKTENVVIVTPDGMRWQEAFGGADSAILQNKKYTKDSGGTNGKFWSGEVNDRRKKLLPFLWGTIAAQGQLYGNRWLGSKPGKNKGPDPAFD